MRIVAIAVAAAAVLGGVWTYTEHAGSAFHLMRVYGVMGGAEGDASIQYVELRMTDSGQNLVSGHHICFYDETGAPWARFRFPSSVSNGSDEASILIGTAEFDSAWAAGSPDFTFSSANTVAINGSADVDHPLVAPAGKVAFGTDGTSTVSQMCQGSFALIDSVAYGSGFTGTADYPPAFGSDLPSAGTQTLRLQGPICHPDSFSSSCPQPRDNSQDYALVDTNSAGNNPRNNANNEGPVDVSEDADGDGYPNSNEAGTPLCAGASNEDAADDGLVNDGCPAIGSPETACANATDDDGDTVVNDGCPQAGTFAEGQFNIGTNPNGPCSEGAEAGPSPSWPSDFASGGVLDSTDRIDITDITTFVAPTRRLGTSPGDAAFDSRWDISPGPGLLATWINIGDLTLLVAGPTGNPPMFNGERAFNGPTCSGP